LSGFEKKSSSVPPDARPRLGGRLATLRPVSRLKALRLYYFAIFAALGLYLPFFPLWLEARGIEGFAMGIVAAAFPAMSIVGPPAFGLLADALRLRGSLLRVACLGTFVAFAFLAGSSLTDRPLGFVGILCTVLVFAFFRSPMVMMADVLALEHAAASATTYPRIRLWGSVGFLVAATTAGWAIDPTGASLLPLSLAAVLFLALIVSFALPTRAALHPLVQSAPGQIRRLAWSAEFRLFLAASFLGQAAHSAYDLTYSLHLRDLGFTGSMVGIAWAIGVIAEIALMAFSSRLSAAISPPWLLAFALLGASVRWAILALVRSPLILLSLQPMHALSFGLMWIASMAFVKSRAAPQNLATVQGIYVATIGGASVTGMLLWGPLYRSAGGATTFAAAAAVALAAAAMAALFAKKPKIILQEAPG
jgi:PPP family 3-phenylpropionic acid transporter